MKRTALLLIACFSMSFIMAQNIQQPGMFIGTVTKKVSVQYLLYLPVDYQEAKSQSFPLLIFLHGSGERGDNLDLLKINGLPKLIDDGEEFPFIVLSPQCPALEEFSIDALYELFQFIVSEYRVNTKQIFLTGLSMGGTATWDLAYAYPDYFAAIVPICGRVNRNYPERASEIAALPIWVFHGANDKVVPISVSANLVEALQEKGSDVMFTIYPTGGHNIWNRAYKNPELYNWLLQKSK